MSRALADMVYGLGVALNRQRVRELTGWSEQSIALHRKLMNEIQAEQDTRASRTARLLCRARRQDGASIQ